MTRLEAFLIIVGFLVVVLAYVWRRLGEPSPKHVESDHDNIY
jgi:hypothetical protein